MEEIVENSIPDSIRSVIHHLQNNNMQAQYIPRREEVAKAVSAMLHKGDTIAVGGSNTLDQCNILNLLRNGDYHFIDRYEEGLSETEKKNRLKGAFLSDVFLCSANAITKDGEIYQVDGLSNRIAPLVFDTVRHWR